MRRQELTAQIEKATFEGSYEITEAARILSVDTRIPDSSYRVNSSHLIRWIRSGLSHPKLVSVPGRGMVISFEDLISMRVVAFLRARKYSFTKIRKAETDLRRITKHPRPFATQQIWAEEHGTADVWAEIGALLMVAGRHGQLAFAELVQQDLINVHGLTFDEKRIADSWQAQAGIMLHPRVQYGRPCIAGTRIPTSDIVGMVRAGDSKDSLACSYGITIEDVEKAISWERELAAA